MSSVNVPPASSCSPVCQTPRGLKNELRYVVASALAGATAIAATYPLEVLRTQRQAGAAPQAPSSRMGLLAYYRGLPTAMGCSMAAAGLRFPVYMQLNATGQALLRQGEPCTDGAPISPNASAWCSAGAGSLSAIVTTAAFLPAEIAKTRLQAGCTLGAITLWGAGVEVYRTRGWRGLMSNWHTAVPLSAVWGAMCFGGKTLAQAHMPILLPAAAQEFISAITGATLATTALYPIYTALTRVRTAPPSMAQQCILYVVKELWRTQGARGFVRGFPLEVTRTSCSFAITYVGSLRIYDLTRFQLTAHK